MAAFLDERQFSTVEELQRRFGVSDMTIRRDLAALARAGRVIRTHGGASAAPKISFEFAFLRRQQTAEVAKQAIGRAAANLVQDGQSVLLDSGTTTLAVATALKARRNLTVITTSLPVASALQFCPTIRVLLLGGFVRADSPDLSGAVTESNLEQLHADVAIVGADGVDDRGRVYHAAPEVARLVGKMAAAAARVYVVADSSKLGRKALARSGDLTKWDGLVTELPVPGLKRAGVNVVVAGKTEET